MAGEGTQVSPLRDFVAPVEMTCWGARLLAGVGGSGVVAGVGVAEGAFEFVDGAVEADDGGLETGKGVAPVLGTKGGEAHVEMVHRLVELGDGVTDGVVVQEGGFAGRFCARVAASQNSGGD